jgi:hypothetical protein
VTVKSILPHSVLVSLLHVVDVEENSEITTSLNMKRINIKGPGENTPYAKIMNLLIVSGALIWR